MANSFDHIKFQVCWYKKDVISYDDFIEWATGVYPIYAKPLMQRHGLVKWTSTANSEHFKEPLRQALKTTMGRPQWTVPDYDLIMTYWAPSLDNLFSMTADPEWAELEKETSARATLSIGFLVVGHETVHFESNNMKG